MTLKKEMAKIIVKYKMRRNVVMKKYIGLEDMSKVNCSSVLNVIREAKEISRKEISDITGLSWGGMTKIVNKLFEKGYIKEEKNTAATGAGRTPGVITICKDYNVVIGLDINREGLMGCVLNLAGDVLKEYSGRINFNTKDELLKSILSFTSLVVKENNKKNILAIGVAMQGIVDSGKGISIKFPGCSDWENVPIQEILGSHFYYPVFVEHDPNCMLYSAVYNHPTENSVLFRMDRSIGMAVTIDGKILEGNGLLEVAHSIVVPGGKECVCGKRGCVESYIGSCLGDGKLKEEALQEMIKIMPVVMYNMVQMFHATKIILTGKLVEYKDKFEKALLEEFSNYCDLEKIKVEFMEETKKAVYGAAMIAVRGAIDSIEV